MNEKQNILTGLGRGIPNLSQILQEATQKFDDRIERLKLAFSNVIKTKTNQVELCGLKPFYIKNLLEKNMEALRNLSSRLSASSVEAVLNRGFAWVKDDLGQTVYTSNQAKEAKSLEIRFADGAVSTNQSANNVITPHKKRKPKEDESQISLFDM